jgi:polygalacturonase
MSGLSPTRIVLVLSAIVMLGFVAFVSIPRPVSRSADDFGAAPARLPTLPFVSALDWLPMNAVRDGSVDYTSQLQAAIDAAAGRTLFLPDFPVRVSRAPGAEHCLIARSSIEIVGAPTSRLVESEGGVTILRVEDAQGVRLRGFALRGRAARGTAREHALLTVDACREVLVDGVSALDSDGGGIAVIDSDRVTVRGARALRVAGDGLRFARCDGLIVTESLVEHVGGRALEATTGGTGLRLSACRDVTCTSNVVRDGRGVGILADAEGGAATSGFFLANRVADWIDPRQPGRDAGIRFEGPGGSSGALAAANVIERCGPTVDGGAEARDAQR